jgi:hypothetical protein
MREGIIKKRKTEAVKHGGKEAKRKGGGGGQ